MSPIGMIENRNAIHNENSVRTNLPTLRSLWNRLHYYWHVVSSSCIKAYDHWKLVKNNIQKRPARNTLSSGLLAGITHISATCLGTPKRAPYSWLSNLKVFETAWRRLCLLSDCIADWLVTTTFHDSPYLIQSNCSEFDVFCVRKFLWLCEETTRFSGIFPLPWTSVHFHFFTENWFTLNDSRGPHRFVPMGF